jgi:hypothetical protein
LTGGAAGILLGGREGSRGVHIERAEEGDRWVGKGGGMTPDQEEVYLLVGGGGRDVTGAEEDLFAEEDGAIGWVRGVAMPFAPPTHEHRHR